ncbi:UNVERIFIED_CONTAM: hypothetical protein Sradi_3995700 [Sesamum radiatum]|uniref:Uncharacterized protein n=1 Tax=Sesamum radiatum TaxID=300843 RepID=A0AAW2PK86_SESRA
MSRLQRGANETLCANRGPPSPQAICSTTSQLPIWICVCAIGAVEAKVIMGASSPPFAELRTMLLLSLYHASLCSSPRASSSLMGLHISSMLR